MMKRILNLVLMASLIFSVACKGKKTSAEGIVSEVSEDASYAVCIWDRASLKEAPEEKGKWLESLSLGEKCEYLDETKEDNSGTKQVQYYKVRLLGGKEGWVQSTLIALNSKPAALSQDAEVYSRPDLLTKTDKAFSKMDIVAVKGSQGDFLEVTGKRTEGKWIETGWIKANNVTYSDVDIAVAKFGSKALRMEDEVKKQEAIKQIISNSDFSNSIFINDLSVLVAEQEPALDSTEVDIEEAISE
jgi:hypothetical protein